MEKPKLVVIGTGGTIAGSATTAGAKPILSVEKLADEAPYLRTNFDLSAIQLSQKDSSLIDHKDWIRITQETYRASSQGSNVLILHGTDTLAYTSSALSFAIQNPQTSIVLTGSMKILEDPKTDVRKNLLGSAVFLSDQTKGIYVVFNGKVMTASRITKIHSMDVNAFETIDNKYVATVEENTITYHNKPIESNASMSLLNRFDNRVYTLKVTPGLPKDIFNAIIDKGFKAVNIATFGTGIIPHIEDKNDPKHILGFLLRAKQTANKIPVVITSQVSHGGVNLKKYEAGRNVEVPPFISGEDMTQEAAHVKLMWCLGQGMNLDETRKSFEKSYAGEITL